MNTPPSTPTNTYTHPTNYKKSCSGNGPAFSHQTAQRLSGNHLPSDKSKAHYKHENNNTHNNNKQPQRQRPTQQQTSRPTPHNEDHNDNTPTTTTAAIEGAAHASTAISSPLHQFQAHPSGTASPQATSGNRPSLATLCGACWQQFCTHRRKRARTDEVIIVGLRNQPDLNYTSATIISYDTTTARWLVDATARPGTLLRLKAENLQQNTPDQPRKHKRNTRAQHANNLDIVAEQPQQQPQQQQTQQPQQQRRSAAPPCILAATSTRRSRFRLRSDATARPPG